MLIETLPAAFEMDEILYALQREYRRPQLRPLGLYLLVPSSASAARADRLTPDRAPMTMDKAFLAAYSLRLVATCHRRGAFAMGGMSAFIPVKGDEAANRAALDKVRADKLREVGNGHDGTWVAHPALVPVAMEAFEAMHGPNQLSKMPEHVPGRDEMLKLHEGAAHRSRRAREHPRRRPVSRRLARREGRGAALQSDGGCGDGGDLPHAAVAMAEVRSAARRRPRASPSTCSSNGSTRRSACSPKCPTSPKPRG